MWNWKEMVAQLTDESMKIVVDGPGGRSGGLVACTFSARPNSYDHELAFCYKRVDRMVPNVLPKFDFCLHRVDGSGIRLHPRYSCPNIETFELTGHAEQVLPPAAGKGGSDGPGTYRHHRRLSNQQTLYFDPSKRVSNKPAVPLASVAGGQSLRGVVAPRSGG